MGKNVMTLKDEIMEWVVGTLYMLTLFAAGWFCMVVF